MSFTTICPNGTILPDLKRCSNIKPGETVSCCCYKLLHFFFFEAPFIKLSRQTRTVINNSSETPNTT